MSFITLDGTVCGTIRSASYGKNQWGKDRLKLEGVWEGTNATTLDCPVHVGDQLAAVGAMGTDQAGVWVDSNKRVAIWKNKEGTQTIWGAGDGAGLQTQMAPQQQRSSSPPQGQRPMTPRPAGAPQSSPPQSPPQGRPQNNGQSQRPAASLPKPVEPPDATRRRLEVTFAVCLKVAAKAWADSGIEIKPDSATIQSSAATLFIAINNAGCLLADPQAPPPINTDQKAALAGFRTTWHRLSVVVNGQIVIGPALDEWFNAEVAKFGHPSALTHDQANRVIDHMAQAISAREKEIENAKSQDPQPPIFTGKESDIPF